MDVHEVLAQRYEIVERIGGGGMAEVYKAHDKVLDRPVAIKILHQQFANDEEFVNKFHKEALQAAKLNHPNIVAIYDVGIENGVHYIVMEYVPGGTLKSFITKYGAFKPDLALRIAREIAGALETAHRNNLVHCDIKSHNILMTTDGHAKVADFGIARAVSSATMTYGDSVMGSVHYFSPEQAKGMAVTGKSDIYSLGVVFYEMLTGRLPFIGQTPVGIALKHIQDEAVPVRQIIPDIPTVIEAIVMKAMAKNPDERPSAAELIAEMNRAEAMMSNVPAAQQEDLDATHMMPRITPEMESRASLRKAGKLKPRELPLESPEEMENEDKRGYTGYRRQEKPKSVFKSRKFIFGLVAILVLGFFVGTFMSYGKFWSSAEIQVPDVVGKQSQIAQQMLQDKNLRVKIAETYDDKVPAGQVVSQYPEAGSKVKEKRLVTIYISKGGEEMKMPDVKGMSRDNAEDKLSRMGLKVSVYEKESSQPVGQVISQDPSAGSKIAKGQTVDITVSKGEPKKKVKVTSYIGKSADGAQSALENEGINVNVEYKESSQPKGTVIGQSQTSGTILQGDTITLTVSSGRATANKSRTTNNNNSYTSRDDTDKDDTDKDDTNKDDNQRRVTPAPYDGARSQGKMP